MLRSFIIDIAKIRTFLHTHNSINTAFRIPQIWQKHILPHHYGLGSIYNKVQKVGRGKQVLHKKEKYLRNILQLCKCICYALVSTKVFIFKYNNIFIENQEQSFQTSLTQLNTELALHYTSVQLRQRGCLRYKIWRGQNFCCLTWAVQGLGTNLNSSTPFL